MCAFPFSSLVRAVRSGHRKEQPKVRPIGRRSRGKGRLCLWREKKVSGSGGRSFGRREEGVCATPLDAGRGSLPGVGSVPNTFSSCSSGLVFLLVEACNPPSSDC